MGNVSCLGSASLGHLSLLNPVAFALPAGSLLPPRLTTMLWLHPLLQNHILSSRWPLTFTNFPNKTLNFTKYRDSPFCSTQYTLIYCPVLDTLKCVVNICWMLYSSLLQLPICICMQEVWFKASYKTSPGKASTWSQHRQQSRIIGTLESISLFCNTGRRQTFYSWNRKEEWGSIS